MLFGFVIIFLLYVDVTMSIMNSGITVFEKTRFIIKKYMVFFVLSNTDKVKSTKLCFVGTEFYAQYSARGEY